MTIASRIQSRIRKPECRCPECAERRARDLPEENSRIDLTPVMFLVERIDHLEKRIKALESPSGAFEAFVNHCLRLRRESEVLKCESEVLDRILGLEKEEKNMRSDVAGDLRVQVTTPIKKPKNKELTTEQNRWNAEISSIRVRVEHCIGWVKNWKVIGTKFRCSHQIYTNVLQVVCGFVNDQTDAWQRKKHGYSGVLY